MKKCEKHSTTSSPSGLSESTRSKPVLLYEAGSVESPRTSEKSPQERFVESQMVLCPLCGWPHERPALVGSFKCECCTWSGRTSEMLSVDPDAAQAQERLLQRLERFHTFLAEQLSPVIGNGLIQLELVDRSRAKDNIRKFATILRAATNAAYKAAITELYAPEGNDVPAAGRDLRAQP